MTHKLHRRLVNIERERDIPAFQGTTWRERVALRHRAEKKDHSIIWLYFLCPVPLGPTLGLSLWLAFQFTTTIWAFVLAWAICSAVGVPYIILFYSLFITPRVRRALESHEDAIAYQGDEPIGASRRPLF